MDFISQSYLQKFRSCYNKCVKAFFGYKKYDSVTVALFETRVPSVDIVLHNARYTIGFTIVFFIAFYKVWLVNFMSVIVV